MTSDPPAKPPDGDIGAAETRGFLVTLVTVSLMAFDMAFSVGAYGDLFFETYLKVWVAATVVILGSALLPKAHRPIDRRGMILLLLPSLFFPASAATTWLVSLPAAETAMGQLTELLVLVFMILTALAYLIAMPYIVFTLARILDPSLVQMPTRRMRVGLVAIALLLGACGLGLGLSHPYWLTCDDFRVAGANLPENCTEVLFHFGEPPTP